MSSTLVEKRSGLGPNQRTDRRQFLARLGAGAAATALATTWPSQALASFLSRHPARALKFKNNHTGESLRVTFWENGYYIQDALAEIDHLLRDHRTGDVHPMDPALLDLLFAVHDQVGSRDALHVISGYRSPKTNRMLAARSRAVDKNSYHMRGKAIDIRVHDRPLSKLRDAAIAMDQGGVGYYGRSAFLHVDTGPVRSW